MNNSVDNKLHITVGAAIQHELNLEQELGLLKAALLYADKVKLCSLTSSMLVTMLPLGYLNEDEQLELIAHMAPSLGESSAPIEAGLELYKSLKRKKRRSKQELLLYLNMENSIKKGFEELRTRIEGIANSAGAEGLLQALDTGLVDFELLDVNSDDLVQDFFDSIEQALLSGKTYPLFDESTGKLVKLAIEEGKIVPLGSSVAKARQVGLSTGLLSRLPLFDHAAVDEIIDIRTELENPLTRFRAAIVGFSNDIETIPWDPEFSFSIQQVFIERVEPAVLEIEDAVKSNRLLLELIARTVTYGVSASSALGIMMSQLEQFPEILMALSAAAGATRGAYDAVKKHRERKEEIERSQLYFYYRAGNMLSGK